MFIVTITNNGQTYYLRSTIWAFAADRAQRFETEAAARAQLEKARKFMKAAQFKQAVIAVAA